MTQGVRQGLGKAKGAPRDLIVQAAADSLLENGYAGTSVRSIASRAGVAIGNLQYYFPTKSALLIEAWRHLTERSVHELRASLNNMTDPIWLIESGIASIWESLRRLGDIQLAAFDLLVQAPKQESLQAFPPQLFDRYRDAVEEQLDRLARHSRRLGDPRDTALRVAFAGAIGGRAGGAAAERGIEPARRRLLRAIEQGR